ncbi:MAG TPA: DUF4956 domain-containing protein [Xanthomonadales bacterium]|nr:DUF4956 domain-containing protein [Xanthomonadales bacterium]
MSTRSHDRALFFKLTVFYGLLFGLTALAFHFQPDIGSHLPIGDIERHLNTEPVSSFDGVEIQASQVITEFDSLLWLVTAILGSVILMIPVSWTYLAIRRQHQMDQSLLQSMLILPIAVTGIVLLVHNSLALAFSLAGVVAGVRYRNTLKSTADSIFIFVAVGVGLSSGIGMLIVGAVMTLIFNFTILILWKLNYGRREEAKQYMRLSKEAPDRGDEFENELTG